MPVEEYSWDSDDEVLQASDSYSDSDLTFFRVTVENPEYFAVLNKNITAVLIHAVKGSGYYQCTGEADCPLCKASEEYRASYTKDQRKKMGQDPVGPQRRRFGVIVAWYHPGNTENPVEPAILAFSGTGKFQAIKGIKEEWAPDGDIRKIDLKATVADKSKEGFQDFALTPRAQQGKPVCMYLKDKKLGEILKKKLAGIDWDLGVILGKSRSMDELQAIADEALHDMMRPASNPKGPAGMDIPEEAFEDAVEAAEEEVDKKAQDDTEPVDYNDVLDGLLPD